MLVAAAQSRTTLAVVCVLLGAVRVARAAAGKGRGGVPARGGGETWNIRGEGEDRGAGCGGMGAGSLFMEAVMSASGARRDKCWPPIRRLVCRSGW